MPTDTPVSHRPKRAEPEIELPEDLEVTPVLPKVRGTARRGGKPLPIPVFQLQSTLD
jgi:hypothetical protein